MPITDTAADCWLQAERHIMEMCIEFIVYVNINQNALAIRSALMEGFICCGWKIAANVFDLFTHEGWEI